MPVTSNSYESSLEIEIHFIALQQFYEESSGVFRQLFKRFES